MQSAISCHCFLYHDLVADGVIELIASHGFHCIELWAMQPHFPYRDSERIEEISVAMNKYGAKAVSAHLPMYEKVHAPGELKNLLSPSDLDEGRRKLWVEEALAAAQASHKLGAGVLTLHTDINFAEPEEIRLNAFHKSIEEIFVHGLPQGCTLAVENTPGGSAQVEGIMNLIHPYPSDEIGVTLDIGHAHIDTDLIEAVKKLGPRLLSAHAHDNDGVGDDHLLPGKGNVPWDELKAALDKMNFGGPLVWEIRDPSAGKDPGLEVKSQILKELRNFDERFSQS